MPLSSSIDALPSQEQPGGVGGRPVLGRPGRRPGPWGQARLRAGATRGSAWLLPVALVFSTACGSDDCTDLGCDEDDRAAFSFDDPAAGWEQDVSYRFAATWEGQTRSCEGTLADGLVCDSEEIHMERTGFGTEDDMEWSVDALILSVFPGEVTLRIEREGQVVHEQVYDVVAELEYPNGEDCPPECRTWHESVPGW